MTEEKLNPFSSKLSQDYKETMEEFGISKITPELKKELPSHYLIKRGIIFAHRDLDKILEAHQNKEPFAVMTGIKPTNKYHLGNKLVVDQLVYFQEMGAKIYFSIADLETHHVQKSKLEESVETAVDNIADLLALGVKEDNYFYRQSEEKNVLRLGHQYYGNVTYNMLKSIYGEKPVNYYDSALVQVADINLPQLEKFGGKKPVVVPVGIDQDPHIRLTRKIAAKHKLTPPSATYNKTMRSLTGSTKMSKSEPKGIVTLSQHPKEATEKLKKCYTGGRSTARKQKKLGGNPDDCVCYELFMFLFEKDDQKLKNRYRRCRNGELTCGECKQECAKRLKNFLKKHQKKKKKKIDKAREIVMEG